MKVVLGLGYAKGFWLAFHVVFVFTAIALQRELYSIILRYLVEML